MTRAGLFFICILIASVVPAQDVEYPEICISSVNSLESKTLTADFFNAFYFGQFIDSTTKWDAISQLKDNNHLGFFSHNRVDVWLPSKKKYSFYVSGTYQSMLGIGFTKGLFQLVFAGNNSLVGQTVLMDPARINQYGFSSVAGGITYPITDDIKAFAAAGPVCMYSFSQLDFSQSSFFTSQAADSLSLTLNGSYSRAGGPVYIKGVGIGAEIGIQGINGDFEWTIMAGNMGKVWLNDRTIDSQRDTMMKFTGVEVSDLSSFNAVVETDLDNFEEGFSLKGDTMKKSIALPLLLSGECTASFGRLKTSLGIFYYHLPGFVPFTSLTPSWPVVGSFRVALPLKYGGYGSFNAGIGIETKITDCFTLQLNAPSLLSLTGNDKNISYIVCGKLVYKIAKHESLL